MSVGEVSTAAQVNVNEKCYYLSNRFGSEKSVVPCWTIYNPSAA